mmetsp:Transcript_46415/g.91348  ORF Transcript_46415/g.91348 Transcript_46415/m.91348 type:complete len:210 (+) Transcript_46415:1871-2500(+)
METGGAGQSNMELQRGQGRLTQTGLHVHGSCRQVMLGPSRSMSFGVGRGQSNTFGHRWGSTQPLVKLAAHLATWKVFVLSQTGVQVQGSCAQTTEAPQALGFTPQFNNGISGQITLGHLGSIRGPALTGAARIGAKDTLAVSFLVSIKPALVLVRRKGEGRHTEQTLPQAMNTASQRSPNCSTQRLRQPSMSSLKRAPNFSLLLQIFSL